MKAILKYSSGLQLQFPTASFAPALFLEWMANNPKVKLESVHTKANGKISVRLFATREIYESCLEYINANLPDEPKEEPVTEKRYPLSTKSLDEMLSHLDGEWQ